MPAKPFSALLKYQVLLLAFFLPFAVAAQPTASVKDKLASYKTSHIAEQASLHFDKAYYAAGDTMYFKAYVTMGERHQLSQLSGVLHVELINTKNKIDQSLLLKLNNGLAWGDFALPDSLPAGRYRVRAYTQWMRNAGEDAFFCRFISIGSGAAKKIAESGTRQEPAGKPDVQFFPEGGALVAGIKSKIAFKAISGNGLGIDVKGTVAGSNNKTVTAFASAHLGMGYFELTPESGVSFKASLTFADGSQTAVDLPAVSAKGITLSVDNDSLQKATVLLQANQAYFNENKNKEYTVIIYSGGLITSVGCVLDSTVLRFDLAKRRLHTGIATATLFLNNEPLCERLFFVQNYDQLQFNIASDKNVYSRRGRTDIRITAKNRADSVVAAHCSISVIDEGKAPVDDSQEHTILTNLLLTDDLRGEVEQPNYYFSNINGQTLSNLDLVMLTHGYRRFEWKRVLNDDGQTAPWQPEHGLEIAGVAKTLGGKPVRNGTASLISQSARLFLTENTDGQGNFKFTNLDFVDSAKFVLQAATSDGSNKTQLVYKATPAPGVTPAANLRFDQTPVPPAYLQNKKEELVEYAKTGSLKSILLQEVKINAIRSKDNYRSSVLGGPGNADQVIHMEDIKTGGTLADKLTGILRGITIESGLGSTKAFYLGQQMGVVVDGILMRSDYDFGVLNNDVETVEVLKYASASIYGMGGGNGMLVFTTKIGGASMSDIPSYGILPLTIQGYHKGREFYAPRYEGDALSTKRKDLRTTIYWNPELLTGTEGNSSIDFYTADTPGTYRVTIEGIDEKGNLGRQVYRYTVN